MAAFRPVGTRGMSEETLNPGDTELGSAIVQSNATVGAVTISAASMLNGYIRRSGSTAAYTDTLDTAANLYTALAGNGSAPAIVPGMSFLLRIVNSVAFIETITLGSGMVAGQGTVATIAASTWREFLFTFESIQPPVTVIANTISGSATVTWSLAPGQVAIPEGPSPFAVNLAAGAFVSGTGIAAATTVLGVTAGQGGSIGATLSGTATATGANVALTFGPYVQVDGVGSGTL